MSNIIIVTNQCLEFGMPRVPKVNNNCWCAEASELKQKMLNPKEKLLITFDSLTLGTLNFSSH